MPSFTGIQYKILQELKPNTLSLHFGSDGKSSGVSIQPSDQQGAGVHCPSTPVGVIAVLSSVSSKVMHLHLF